MGRDAELLAEAVRYRWSLHSRADQATPPGDWRTWMLVAGRGAGKTRAGAEWVRMMTGRTGRIALVGPTAADVRDTMVEGESGILSCFPPSQAPKYEPSKRRVTFHNGAVALCFTAEEPDRLRGPQHGAAWCDELAAWRYPRETWDMLMFGMRMGRDPRTVVTTTPRPTRTVKELMQDPHTVITRASTYDNARNLAPPFLERILERYEGTRLGRQEIHAELLEDNPDALWKRSELDEHRVSRLPEGGLVRVVVGMDPSASSGGDEVGIVAAGVSSTGEYYILDDASMQGSPAAWARQGISCLSRNAGDRIVAEGNNGGEMVTHTLRTEWSAVPVKLVHASRGKRTRAEPISALFEQGKVHLVGSFPKLEDEMCEWVPGDESPNRMDAMVWAMTELRGRRSTTARTI